MVCPSDDGLSLTDAQVVERRLKPSYPNASSVGLTMPDDYGFAEEEIEKAFRDCGGMCECCGKRLCSPENRGNSSWGQWAAHHGSRYSPVILCTGGRENCHLNCGHDRDWQNEGITPRIHKGG